MVDKTVFSHSVSISCGTRKLITERYLFIWLKLKWEDLVVTRHINSLVIEYVFRVAWIRMFCSVGLHILTKRSWSHAKVKHKSGRQGKFLLSEKQRLSGWHCPSCDRCFLCNDRWNEKQPILILQQSAIICKPTSAALHPFFPSLSHSSTHLLQTKPTILSPCSLKETPMQTWRSCL